MTRVTPCLFRAALTALRRVCALLLLFVCHAADGQDARPAGDILAGRDGISFTGICGASAAVALNPSHFAVADDEMNLLCVFDMRSPGRPVAEVDLRELLSLPPGTEELDLEGATRVGNRIYWIGSHGRNEDGQWRPARHYFFATDFEERDGQFYFRLAGQPGRTLAAALAGDADVQPLGFEGAIKAKELKSRRRAPDREGLDIEALAAAPAGDVLYVGLRNPKLPNPQGSPRAIIVPLLNAASVVESGSLPDLGPPLLWDLAGGGIQAMEYDPAHQAFFIVSAATTDAADFALWRWSGAPDEAPARLPFVSPVLHFQAEALSPFPEGKDLLLISDDSSQRVFAPVEECMHGHREPDGSCPSKYLRDRWWRSFRAQWAAP